VGYVALDTGHDVAQFGTWALPAKRSVGTERGTGELVEEGGVGTAAREVESICGVNVGCGLGVDEW
jgi:hypothetical protein